MVDDRVERLAGVPGRFSRMRSKTTIVSWTLKPMTVSIAVTNRASTCMPRSVPRMANVPTTTMTSWSRAMSAEAPNSKSWKRKVIQARMPIEPEDDQLEGLRRSGRC